MFKREKPKSRPDEAPEKKAHKRQVGANRTAWIIGAIALAFYIASYLQGHFGRIPLPPH